MTSLSRLGRVYRYWQELSPFHSGTVRAKKSTRRTRYDSLKPSLQFSKLEDRKMLANLTGTSLNDAFVLNYSLQTSTVAVTMSTNGGAATGLGTFGWAEPINLNGLAGTDSVEVKLLSFSAGYAASITGSGITINSGGLLTRTNTESLKIVGSSQDDSYRFTADSPLGLMSIDESAGDTNSIWGDTLDFSTTSSAVNINLGFSTSQVVNENLSLNLMSGTTFEIALGGAGHDNLTGNSRNNRLIGNAGNDKLYGISGSDTLDGGAGNDTLHGGTGEDNYIFAMAATVEADEVVETSSESAVGLGDALRFSDVTIPVKLNLGTTSVQNVHTNRTLKLSSASTFETVFGGSGNDFLTGNSLRNYLYGNSGHDILIGGAGNDVMHGESGRDILIGGLGSDTIDGGTGDDILIAGTTSSARELDLNAIRNIWISNASYSERVQSIHSGPIGESLVANVSVFDDGAVDILTGGADRDWFFSRWYTSDPSLDRDQTDREFDEIWYFL